MYKTHTCILTFHVWGRAPWRPTSFHAGPWYHQFVYWGEGEFRLFLVVLSWGQISVRKTRKSKRKLSSHDGKLESHPWIRTSEATSVTFLKLNFDVCCVWNKTSFWVQIPDEGCSLHGCWVLQIWHYFSWPHSIKRFLYYVMMRFINVQRFCEKFSTESNM